ncbi:MAG: tRNA (guanosine(37)-N1)-methyltransferase TrmD [Oscillospiraceae bacterium]|jgi:tRNA (guanine37-N1)-methyltransferase|nr:tRNA (guanosine(37)-N1)-methyltransferase TrmD [Oscillospiraceae bacterium]
MEIDFLTLFPGMINALLGESIIARAAERGHIKLRAHQIRDFADNARKQVDDYPYGGGAGVLMQAEPLCRCLTHVTAAHGNGRVILLSPQGAVFTQGKAALLAAEGHIILICGHYEGVDERFTEECADEEISIGDYVLTGGEIAACVVADAVCRLIPGVLADESGFQDESFASGLLEYPQYTRPRLWRGRSVPDVLLSGDHAAILRWREEQALRRTSQRRPDLLPGSER